MVVQPDHSMDVKVGRLPIFESEPELVTDDPQWLPEATEQLGGQWETTIGLPKESTEGLAELPFAQVPS